MTIRCHTLILLLCAVTACSDGGTGPDSRLEPRPQPSQITAVSGGNQSGEVRMELPEPLLVRVTDGRGGGISGVAITWTITADGGTLTSASTTTDAQGQAQARWTLGTVAGEQRVSAAASGLPAVSFLATARPGPVARVVVTPDSAVLTDYGDTVRLHASAADQYGNAVTDASVTWLSLDPAVAEMNASGLVRARAAGVARVTATAGVAVDTVDVRVAPEPVATLEISLPSAWLVVGDTLRLTATPRSASGRVLNARGISWSSSNPSVAAIWPDGLVTVLAPGSADITAEAEGKSARSAVTTAPGGGRRVASAAALDSVMIAILRERNLVGASLAVMRNGRLVLARGYGWADSTARRPAGPETVVYMYSVSKAITSAAVLRALDMGLLKLTDSAFTIRADLTPLPGMTEDPRTRGIRVDHLLWLAAGYVFTYTDPQHDCWRGGSLNREEMVRCIRGLPLAFDPGAEQSYNNVGHLVLARVIEGVSGQSYPDFVRQQLLEPVGATGLTLQRAKLAERPTTMTAVYPDDWAAKYGNQDGLDAWDGTGGWTGTPASLLRLWRGIMGGDGRPGLLADSTLRLARSRPPFAVPANAWTWLAPLGYPNPEGASWRFEGIGAGSSGGCTFTSHNPSGTSFVFATNTTPVDCWDIGGRLKPLVLAVPSWPGHDLFPEVP